MSMFKMQFGDFGSKNESNKRSGILLGKIIDIKDPKGLNRVKCEYLTGDDDLGQSEWAYVLTPFGGSENGIFFQPNVGDVVVVAFENGDIHFPFVLGSLWYTHTVSGSMTEVKPPVTIDNGTGDNYTHTIKTPRGIELTMYDEDSKQNVKVLTPGGLSLLLDDENNKIELGSADGKNQIKIDNKSGEITIKSANKIILEVGSSKIEMKDSGNIKMDASQKMEMKTAQFAVDASGSAEIKSSGSLTLNATGSAELKSSAKVAVNASGITEVKGAMVKIN